MASTLPRCHRTPYRHTHVPNTQQSPHLHQHTLTWPKGPDCISCIAIHTDPLHYLSHSKQIVYHLHYLLNILFIGRAIETLSGSFIRISVLISFADHTSTQFSKKRLLSHLTHPAYKLFSSSAAPHTTCVTPATLRSPELLSHNALYTRVFYGTHQPPLRLATD